MTLLGLDPAEERSGFDSETEALKSARASVAIFLTNNPG